MFNTKARRISELEDICDRYQDLLERKHLDLVEANGIIAALRAREAHHLKVIGRLPMEVRRIVEAEFTPGGGASTPLQSRQGKPRK